MKTTTLASIIALAATLTFLTPALSSGLPEFSTEATAQQHCPSDTVVWLNVKSGVYHYKGARWYGTTKGGAYVCEKEAIAAGMRASKRG